MDMDMDMLVDTVLKLNRVNSIKSY